METENGWKLVGKISVDAGLVYIGDPCYLSDKNPFKDWNTFVDKIDHVKETAAISHGLEIQSTSDCAMGIISTTGWGDGIYDVLALIDHGQVKEIRILFDTSISEEEPE
jgi:hypothetical protein